MKNGVLIGGCAAIWFALAACAQLVGIEPPLRENVGGAGGEGGANWTTVSSSSSNGGMGGSSCPFCPMDAGNGAGGMGGGMFCVGCAKFIAPGNATPLCPNPSSELHSSLVKCMCETGCADYCGDNACVGQEATSVCATCTTAGACSVAYSACQSDM